MSQHDVPPRKHLTRRRFLTVSAAAALLPRAARSGTSVARWSGYALGARASMALVGVDREDAPPIFAAVEAEIARLEGIFSLFRAGSSLALLNRTGHLSPPPPDLVDLVRQSDRLHRATGGAFDPTIQPLWLLYARAAAVQAPPSRAERARTQRQTGWRHVHVDDLSLRFARPGMALTFNGIAQGYIADRVAALLRARGLQNVLIDMGEIAALGHRPDGAPWRAGVATPENDLVAQVELRDRALATSAPMGTLLDRSGRVGHIMDPRSGRPGGRWRVVSVTAPTATQADGLSTAFCLMSRSEIDAAVEAYPGTAIAALL